MDNNDVNFGYEPTASYRINPPRPAAPGAEVG